MSRRAFLAACLLCFLCTAKYVTIQANKDVLFCSGGDEYLVNLKVVQNAVILPWFSYSPKYIPALSNWRPANPANPAREQWRQCPCSQQARPSLARVRVLPSLLVKPACRASSTRMQSIAFAVVIFLITLKQYTSRYSVKLAGNMLQELMVLVLWSIAAVT